MEERVFENKRLIAFVSNSAWSVYNFRLDVLRHLKEQGYEILVIAPDDEYSGLLIKEGFRFLALEFNNRSENPIRDLRLYWRLRSIYRRLKPDFIFHYVVKPNIYGSLAAHADNLKSISVVTGLGYAFARKNWLYRLTKFLYRISLKRAKEVWFLNNEDAKIFTSQHIVNIRKMKVLPGEGVNTDYFSKLNFNSSPKERFVFLMSTRLLKSKGVSIYVDAARILKRKGIFADFDLIGFFEKHHPDSIAEKDLKKWETEGLVNYRGFARDVREFLASADCFIFPSFYHEGIPKCLMEAASMELPIITSLNRGCKEVVTEGLNGFICNSNDPFDLADKMEKMINLSRDERLRMGKSGRQLVVKKFNVLQVIGEYERTLSTFLK
ncbi:MAG TPA: glycosyltransferase family 4 protein [Puia sp.]|nr:glycosyltransferase family 4 protein [Puia sp.]